MLLLIFISQLTATNFNTAQRLKFTEHVFLLCIHVYLYFVFIDFYKLVAGSQFYIHVVIQHSKMKWISSLDNCVNHVLLVYPSFETGSLASKTVIR